MINQDVHRRQGGGSQRDKSPQIKMTYFPVTSSQLMTFGDIGGLPSLKYNGTR